MSLSEKQAYFRYGESNWSYKEPPVLSEAIVRAMKREGLDKTYRIIWGGVAVYRTEPEQLKGEIKGDERATKINEYDGRLQPTYLFVNARQPVRDLYCYSDPRTGDTVKTTREEFVPPGVPFFVEVQYEYVQYGILNWFLEQFHAGEWHCIKRLETPDGHYYEPNDHAEDVLNIMRKREYQNRNENLDDVIKREREELARALKERQQRESRKKRATIDRMYRDEVERAERAPVYSIPN